ncbi:MAG: hypothetical protein ACFFD4_19440 [Candidatus Odinarchaeota archaeon]
MNPKRNVLLLNASNLKTNLTYPYAFVQVSEIADRCNIRVIRQDLFGIQEEQWEVYLRELLKKESLDMVLITLRNTDTCDSEEYRIRSVNKNYHHQDYLRHYERLHYYPIRATKFLIEILRKITDVPVVVGGYAFSKMSEKLMRYLQPDYGVIGGPDGFFEHFEDVLIKQDLDRVANLLYQEKNTLKKGPLFFFPPAARREYTDDIIRDRQAFYSRDYPGLDVDKELSVPVEVVRGCPMKCSYCSEPLVEGSQPQYRDLDVIEQEINFLGNHGLNHLYMICSEINTQGNAFFLELAGRITRINERRNPYEKVYWEAMYLMTLSSEELKLLRKAGFLGGSNDVISLEDKNLAAVKAPLRSSRDIISHITGVQKVNKEELQLYGLKHPSLEERIFKGLQPVDNRQPGNVMRTWNLFLGNTAVTPETIYHTLKAVDDAGLSLQFDSCYVNKATRMYDYIQPGDELLKHAWTMTEQGLADAYNELYPSFVHPPALLDHLGSVDALEEFFDRLGRTFLSCNHLFRKKWNWFLNKNVDRNTFLGWWKNALKSGIELESLTAIPEVLDFLKYLQRNPSAKNICLLFNPTPGRKNLMNFAANIAIQFVLFSREKEVIPVMNHLGFPPSLETTLNLSPYKVAVLFFKICTNRKQLFVALNGKTSGMDVSKFFINYLIYLNNTPLREKYRAFFVNNQSIQKK